MIIVAIHNAPCLSKRHSWRWRDAEERSTVSKKEDVLRTKHGFSNGFLKVVFVVTCWRLGGKFIPKSKRWASV